MKNPENTLPENFSGGCVSADEPWVSEAVSFLRKKISDKEYKTEKIRPGMCMINYNDFYVINYDGGIYKCPTFIGKKDFEIGNIKTGVRNYTSVYKLYNWKNRKCAECEYLPLCFGGCRYMTYIKNGNLDEPECKKDFFDKYLGDLLRQEIENNWPGL